LIPIAIIFLAVFSIPRLQKTERRNWAYFVLSLFLVSVIIQLSRQQREVLATQQFAATLIENNDPQAEAILQSVENKLSQEFLVPEDYANFLDKKELVENRIKRLYFSNYLEKYELKLLSFDSLGSNINLNNIYSYEDLDNIYNNSAQRTSSSYFYQITNPASFNGYIAKFENCDLDGHYGTTFILLQPRVVQSEFLYPEVFANQASEEMVNLDDYSYGIYFNNKLINQRGSFPYQLNSLPDTSNRLSLTRAYEHQVHTNAGYSVVLSHLNSGFRTWLSSFTFSLLLLLPLAILLAGICYFTLGKNNSFTKTFIPVEGKYLSARIQSSLTIILLLGLLFSVYIIINYIRSNYNDNLENQLLTTVKNIGSQFQNKVDLEKKLYEEEERLLILNEESSAYKVDINLFNKDGKLLSSTKPYLLENEIVGDLMNPKAYGLLRLENNSQLLIQEELEGSEYLSAYVPLFNGKNHVIGYLNTPYFAKNEELNKQISSLVVNIINIYFLLLLGATALAFVIAKRISKPLLLVQEKMSKTELGARNELISYHREDEIGQLVKQYNKMVMQLDESANQLAESEREGAWREMAKQVAHEIKNPLTPMKLSIQHLQRAYEMGNTDKLDALFAKTSKLLIDQIESLSNMASEFSNFAKMPEKEFEVFNVSEALAETVHLFEQSENIDFKLNIMPDALVNGDAEQIKRVFNNLIKNSIQAIPEGRLGKIVVSLVIDNGRVLVRIQDNGSGIPENIKKRVFVPNFSTKNSGMGLGLAICRKIIEAADGKISFESETNKGATFNIDLPYVKQV
jgi:signal transduction histidine kinase